MPIAAPDAAPLAACLTEEAGLYADLLALGPREREAVVGGDPSDLNRVLAEKECLLAAIARAELVRRAWIADWAAARGEDPAAVTLSTLLAALPPADAAAIAPLRDRLLARVRDVAQMNHEQHLLVQGALRIVNGSLDAYARLGDDVGYRPTGRRSAGGKTAVLDVRA